MLPARLAVQLRVCGEQMPTTLSESLRTGRETLKARHCARWNWREARGTLRNTKGTSFEVMVCVLRSGAISHVDDVDDVNDGPHPRRAKAYRVGQSGQHGSSSRARPRTHLVPAIFIAMPTYPSSSFSSEGTRWLSSSPYLPSQRLSLTMPGGYGHYMSAASSTTYCPRYTREWTD